MRKTLTKLHLTDGTIFQKMFKNVMPVPHRSTVFISIRKFSELQDNLAELGITFI